MEGRSGYGWEMPDGSESLEQLLERGRRLHSRAVFDTLARGLARLGFGPGRKATSPQGEWQTSCAAEEMEDLDFQPHGK
ncbi:hypothetical protein DESUT3_14010 [Desulfuromonas versatilis]|uniref:Uncharacterized protein n=1 Tax=Desulfuromonas versatilis TaxID=2802975 RepID=A0ABM8HTH6_9BACT|nr:hypothetical protein [Desulfuromonas versatilis]BCR04332.1 hypothetical protein DESUT3_14010 [Desulfuromonas versatilis]